jgi:hypothetical protein
MQGKKDLAHFNKQNLLQQFQTSFPASIKEKDIAVLNKRDFFIRFQSGERQ